MLPVGSSGADLAACLPQQWALQVPISCKTNICSWNAWHDPLIRPFSTLRSNKFEILKCILFIAVDGQRLFFLFFFPGSKVLGNHPRHILKIDAPSAFIPTKPCRIQILFPPLCSLA